MAYAPVLGDGLERLAVNFLQVVVPTHIKSALRAWGECLRCDDSCCMAYIPCVLITPMSGLGLSSRELGIVC